MTKAIERGRTVARNASDTPRLLALNPTGTLSTLETAPAIFPPPSQFHAKNFSFAAWVVQYTVVSTVVAPNMVFYILTPPCFRK